MTHKDECNYFKIALALVGICVDDKTADLCVRTWRAVQDKKSKFAIDDAVGIKFAHEEAWIERTIKSENDDKKDQH